MISIFGKLAPVRRLVMALAGLAALLSAHGASAQPVDTRPFQAVFGGAAREPNRRESLGIGFFLEQAHGENHSNDPTFGTPTQAVNGAFSTLGAQSRFDWRNKHVQFGMTGSTSLRYYGRTGELISENHSTSVGLTGQFERTTLFMNQSMTYTPAYLYGLTASLNRQTPGAVASPGADVLLDNSRALVHTTDFDLDRRVGRRGVVSVSSNLQFTTVRGNAAAARGLTTYLVSGSYKHGMTRDLGLVLGYGYHHAEYADGGRPVEHRIDVGFDYHKALSFSRRTTFSSSFGTAILNGPGELYAQSVATVLDASRQLEFRATGQLVHQLGRTWRLNGVYKREVGYVEELGAPVLSSGWTVGADGFMNRRVDVSTNASYTTGTTAFNGRAGFNTYTTNAQIRLAVAKAWALTANYYLYAHDFGYALTPGVPLHFNESVFRVGLTSWVPLRKR